MIINKKATLLRYHPKHDHIQKKLKQDWDTTCPHPNMYSVCLIL